VWGKAQEAMTAVLRSTAIEDLARQQSDNRWN
jgi:DNA-binding IscR family transcriptional regulator